ncbi:hypothetical protein BC829DRAFT_413572 [Chytridium lagenaria]|nr:hypothetical protein BC829DRAFT_413572 [Chytridium lagenaria]
MTSVSNILEPNAFLPTSITAPLHSISNPKLKKGVLKHQVQVLGDSFGDEEAAYLRDFLFSLYDNNKSRQDFITELNEVVKDPQALTAWFFQYVDAERKKGDDLMIDLNVEEQVDVNDNAQRDGGRKRGHSDAESFDQQRQHSQGLSDSGAEDGSGRKFKIKRIEWDLDGNEVPQPSQQQSKSIRGSARVERGGMNQGGKDWDLGRDNRNSKGSLLVLLEQGLWMGWGWDGQQQAYQQGAPMAGGVVGQPQPIPVFSSDGGFGGGGMPMDGGFGYDGGFGGQQGVGPLEEGEEMEGNTRAFGQQGPPFMDQAMGMGAMGMGMGPGGQQQRWNGHGGQMGGQFGQQGFPMVGSPYQRGGMNRRGGGPQGGAPYGAKMGRYGGEWVQVDHQSGGAFRQTQQGGGFRRQQQHAGMVGAEGNGNVESGVGGEDSSAASLWLAVHVLAELWKGRRVQVLASEGNLAGIPTDARMDVCGADTFTLKMVFLVDLVELQRVDLAAVQCSAGLERLVRDLIANSRIPHLLHLRLLLAAAQSAPRCRFWPNCTNLVCPYFHPSPASLAASTAAAAAAPKSENGEAAAANADVLHLPPMLLRTTTTTTTTTTPATPAIPTAGASPHDVTKIPCRFEPVLQPTWMPALANGKTTSGRVGGGGQRRLGWEGIGVWFLMGLGRRLLEDMTGGGETNGEGKLNGENGVTVA